MAVLYSYSFSSSVSSASGNGYAFYQDQSSTALTSSFNPANFGFNATTFTLNNDDSSGANTIIFSYDGVHTHGKLKPTESMTIDGANANSLWLSYSGGAPNYRLFARGAK